MACACCGANCDCTCCLFVNGRNLCVPGKVTNPIEYIGFPDVYQQTDEEWGNFNSRDYDYSKNNYFGSQWGYRLYLPRPACNQNAGGWQIPSAGWKLIIGWQGAGAEYQMQPTLTIGGNGCPSGVTGTFDLIYQTGTPGRVENKPVAEFIVSLAAAISLQCTPSNPLP